MLVYIVFWLIGLGIISYYIGKVFRENRMLYYAFWEGAAAVMILLEWKLNIYPLIRCLLAVTALCGVILCDSLNTRPVNDACIANKLSTEDSEEDEDGDNPKAKDTDRDIEPVNFQ